MGLTRGGSAGALAAASAILLSAVVAVIAQQEARSLRRLSITGGFTSSFNADRTELTLAAGDGPIDGVEVRAPEGGALSVAREPIPARRRVIEYLFNPVQEHVQESLRER